MALVVAGTGGRAMEKLVDSGLVQGVIDVTATEVADFLFGGVLPCTDDRFGAIARTVVPYVGSVGAVDMVNFGALDTVPERYRDRKLYVHNPQVTLMRTTAEENAAIGRWIGARLDACQGQIRFLLPEAGVSLIGGAGGASDTAAGRGHDSIVVDAVSADGYYLTLGQYAEGGQGGTGPGSRGQLRHPIMAAATRTAPRPSNRRRLMARVPALLLTAGRAVAGS